MKHVDYQAYNKDAVMGLVIGQESGDYLLTYAICLVKRANGFACGNHWAALLQSVRKH
jgi:hypothetical protein